MRLSAMGLSAMGLRVAGLRVAGLRVMRFRAPVTADIGEPTAQSQRAGLDHLMRIAEEQAAARQGGDTRRIPAH